MDLSRPRVRCLPRRAAASGALLLAAALGSCSSSENPVGFSGDAMILPATLFEAHRLADRLAREWNEDAFVTRLGGTFTVMDRNGRSRNHSFEFHARFGFSTRRLTVHLVNGSPWTYDVPVASTPPRFVQLDRMIDSDTAVDVAVRKAEATNAAWPDSIPVPEKFAARLLSAPVWPERTSVVDPADSIAWRVDFLVLDVPNSNEFPGDVPIYWSTARFYVHPRTGTLLGDPVIPRTGRELYPFP